MNTKTSIARKNALILIYDKDTAQVREKPIQRSFFLFDNTVADKPNYKWASLILALMWPLVTFVLFG
jgi:hypothetical protein